MGGDPICESLRVGAKGVGDASTVRMKVFSCGYCLPNAVVEGVNEAAVGMRLALEEARVGEKLAGGHNMRVNGCSVRVASHPCRSGVRASTLAAASTSNEPRESERNNG